MDLPVLMVRECVSELQCVDSDECSTVSAAGSTHFIIIQAPPMEPNLENVEAKVGLWVGLSLAWRA
jgi:hypothetical protein